MEDPHYGRFLENPDLKWMITGGYPHVRKPLLDDETDD